MSEWSLKKLEDLIDIKHGWAFKGEYFSDEPTDYILLTPGNFFIGGGFKGDKLKYYTGKVPDEYILKQDELIITMTDLSKEGDTLGYPAKIPKSKKRFLHNQRLGLVKLISNDVNLDFLYWLMRTRNYQRTIVNNASGSTVRHTSPSKIKEYEFKLPPLNEQKEISKTLNVLENKIDPLRRQNETLEAIAQTLFKSWFGEFEFPDENGLPYKSSGGKMVSSELGKIPDGWDEKCFYELGAYINGGAFKQEDFSQQNTGLPIIKIVELKYGITNQTKYTEKQVTDKIIINDKDILFSWSGSPETSIDIFVWNLGRGVLNQHTFKVIPNKTIEKTWLYNLLKFYKPLFIRIAKQKQTTGLGHVTLSDLRKNKVVFPNNKILTKYNLIADPIFKKHYLNLKEINTLSKLRDILLPKLMSGQIRVK